MPARAVRAVGQSATECRRTSVAAPSPSAAAWAGQRASGYNWRGPGGVRYLALEARHRRWAPFANGRATGERGGHRGRRAEPNAGAGTPGVEDTATSA
jgi:hypothetical protein